jgi:hypothetical protein
MIALSGGLIRLLAIARRITLLLTWLGAIALLGGAFALRELATSEDPVAALILAVVLLGPPLVVLHFVMVLRLVQLRLGLFVGGGLLRTLLAARMLSFGMLMHPGYWVLLASSIAACVVIVPVSIGVALL